MQAASVVAKPDDKWGETPCAFVELKPGKMATAEEIIAYCRQHMAHYKVPRHVVFEELPKTSTGKVQKYIPLGYGKKDCSIAPGSMGCSICAPNSGFGCFAN